MAVGSLRAVLAAHAQSSFNGLARRVGARGLWVLVLFLGLLGTTLVLPLVVGLAALGYFLGEGLTEPPSSLAPHLVLGLVLTALSIGGGLISGLSGGARQLDWENYRGFPVRPRTLFLAELFAGLSDLITAIEALALTALCAGVAVAQPRAFFWIALTLLESLLVLLGVQLLLGSLAERLMKRLRAVLIVLAVAAWTMGTFLGSRLVQGKLPTFGAAPLATLLAVTTELPAVRAMAGLKLALAGDLLGAWVAQALALLLVFLIVAIAFLAVSRERPLTIQSGPAAHERLWTFTRPELGLARLQWQTLITSLTGRFGFAMPLIAVVVLRGPFAHLSERGGWMVPGAFAYCALAANQLVFNQFGLDGHGVKALFLLPVSDEAILTGKQWGFAFAQALQAGLLCLLLCALGEPTVDELLAGISLAACFFFAQGMVGQRTSVWMPRRLGRTTMRNGQVPLPVLLVGLATIVFCSFVFGGGYWLLATFARGWLLPGMAMLAVGVFVASRPVLKWNAAYLRRNRERVAEVVGASSGV